MDLFAWSLPFIVDKVGAILDHLVVSQQDIVPKNHIEMAREKSSVGYDKVMAKLRDDINSRNRGARESSATRRSKNVRTQESGFRKDAALKAKIMTMARMRLMLKSGRENSDLIQKVRSQSSDGRLPKNMLFQSRSEIKDYLDHYTAVKSMDRKNERYHSSQRY